MDTSCAKVGGEACETLSKKAMKRLRKQAGLDAKTEYVMEKKKRLADSKELLSPVELLVDPATALTSPKVFSAEEANARSYDFFRNSLGSPKVLLAPMVNQSELAFRMLARFYGAPVCYTPMINSTHFSVSRQYRGLNFETLEADCPLITQFCGDDPVALATSASFVARFSKGARVKRGSSESPSPMDPTPSSPVPKRFA